MKSISSEKCSNSTSLYPYRAKSCLIYFCCYIFFPMSMGLLSFFHAYFKHISAYFSSTKPDFDDTSPWFMILRWYFSPLFLEKSHLVKVLNINAITSYFGRIMILWDFFREKTFLRERIGLSFVLQFSAERMWCHPISSMVVTGIYTEQYPPTR